MANFTASITIDDVMNLLGPVVNLFVPGGKVVRAQVNRVPLPSNPCAVLTEMLQTPLQVPYSDYRPQDVQAIIHGPKRFDIQIDFYGEQAGEFASAFMVAFRSNWGCAQFPKNIQPLYTSDAVQTPLVTGEEQYEARWTVTATLQYNPDITVPQDFADVLTPNEFVPADVFYSP